MFYNDLNMSSTYIVTFYLFFPFFVNDRRTKKNMEDDKKKKESKATKYVTTPV